MSHKVGLVIVWSASVDGVRHTGVPPGGNGTEVFN